MARRIATIAAALVLALLGTLLVVVYVGRADARAVEGVETVEVVVATGPIVVVGAATVASARGAGLAPSTPSATAATSSSDENSVEISLVARPKKIAVRSVASVLRMSVPWRAMML